MFPFQRYFYIFWISLKCDVDVAMHAAVKKMSKCVLNFKDAHALQEECQLSALDQGRYFGMDSMLNDVHLPAHVCKAELEFSDACGEYSGKAEWE